MLKTCEKQLAERFEYTNQGQVEYNLGVEFTQVYQKASYMNSVSETFKVQDCKPVSKPLPLNLDLSLKDSPEEVNHDLHSEYRLSLIHISEPTRPY